jgi:predicted NBD/HSP70 family sugar kinase
MWHGCAQHLANVAFLALGSGVGLGLYVNGQLVRGENGAAGEFGHMFLGDNAPVACSCGRRDCWEAHASEKAMISRYLNGNGSSSTPVDIEHLIGLARNGEKKALAVVRETAKILGIGISNLVIGFSPEAIVISGSIVEAWDIIKDEIEAISRRSIRQELASTAILPSTLGQDPTILGSVSLVLSRKFAAAS